MNVALQKNNGKTFLLAKLESFHMDNLRNVEADKADSAAFHFTNVRIFMFQNEKSKKIFAGGSNVNDAEHIDFSKNRQSVYEANKDIS